MKKQSVLLIVCLVLITVLFGLSGASAPKQVRADGPLPDSPEPGEIIPTEYGNLLEADLNDEGTDTDDQVYLTDKTGINNQIQTGEEFISYGSFGFSLLGSSEFVINSPGCLQSKNTDCGATAYHNVNIPNGSTITYIDFSGADDSPNYSMRLFFESIHFNNKSFERIAELESGDSFRSGPFLRNQNINHIVDNNLNNYRLMILYPRYEEIYAMCVTQITIRYIPPSPFALSLPIIKK